MTTQIASQITGLYSENHVNCSGKIMQGELNDLMSDEEEPPPPQQPPQPQQPQPRTDAELQRQEEEDLRLALALSLNDAAAVSAVSMFFGTYSILKYFMGINFRGDKLSIA